VVIKLTVEGEPISKARARLGRYGNFYTPEKTKGYENYLRIRIKSKLGGREPDKDSYFGVRAIFYRSNRQRIDCDNLMKSVFDAGNELIYKDDKQVTELFGKLFLASPNPRVEFIFYRVKDTTPKQKCAVCGNEFIRPPGYVYKNGFCSHTCRNKSKRPISTEIEQQDFRL
jgi:Holliday junction resolvase RusA-like endonuclease